MKLKVKKSPIILDLCGGTGAWSKPYSEKGYDVRIITLPKYDVKTFIIPENVYGILAAPPCVEFSMAKTTQPRNFKLGLEVVKACLNIIWNCRIKGSLKFWALENPRCYLRQFLGLPVFVFEQWEYDTPRIKPTDIWGYFNLPKKVCFSRPSGLTKRYPNGRINSLSWHSLSAEERAITPEGFARKFFEVNQ